MFAQKLVPICLILLLGAQLSNASFITCASKLYSAGTTIYKSVLQTEKLDVKNLGPLYAAASSHYSEVTTECADHFAFSFSPETFEYDKCTENALGLYSDLSPAFGEQKNMLSAMKVFYGLYQNLNSTLSPCGLNIMIGGSKVVSSKNAEKKPEINTDL